MTDGLENPAQKLEVGVEAGASLGVARGLQGVNNNEFTSPALLACLVSANSLLATPAGDKNW